MEEKNELSDIMLDKGSEKTSKMKKILLLTIALVILFLLILVGMKIYNKPQDKKNILNTKLPPEPSAKTVPKQSELFKQVPIIEENNTKNDNFNAMVEKLKQKEQEAEQPTAQTTIQRVKKKVKHNGIEKALTSFSKKTPMIKKRKILKKRTVYIQVGVTFREKPSKKYLNKIKKAGYKYTLYNTKISGKKATKILIGPYDSRRSANINISKIKKDINKAAFIYVIK